MDGWSNPIRHLAVMSGTFRLDAMAQVCPWFVNNVLYITQHYGRVIVSTFWSRLLICAIACTSDCSWAFQEVEFYFLATSEVFEGWAATCDITHSCWLYSSAPLGDQATKHHDLISKSVIILTLRPTCACPILIMIFSDASTPCNPVHMRTFAMTTQGCYLSPACLLLFTP